jgi:hypothetical protein
VNIKCNFSSIKVNITQKDKISPFFPDHFPVSCVVLCNEDDLSEFISGNGQRAILDGLGSRSSARRRLLHFDGAFHRRNPRAIHVVNIVLRRTDSRSGRERCEKKCEEKLTVSYRTMLILRRGRWDFNDLSVFALYKTYNRDRWK